MSLDTRGIEQAVAEEVARLSQNPGQEIVFSRSAQQHGVDSLALLVLRESLENRFGLTIADQDWIGFDALADLVAHLARTSADAAPKVTAVPAAVPSAPASSPAALTSDGRFEDVVEVGMPMTGLNGLGENPLLKYLGHLRWSHLSAICGAFRCASARLHTRDRRVCHD